MEKTGFIYIWFDRKRKMYYVGCHYGTTNDGYICSSSRMMKAYNSRPEDFKRKILKTGIERKDLLEEEYKWLALIRDDELNDKYYNTQNHHFSHWINNSNVEDIKQKCGEKNKGRKHNLTPEQREARGKAISESKRRKKEERLLLGLPFRKKNSVPTKGRKQSDEERAKRSESLKLAWKEGRNKGTTGRSYEWEETRRQNHRNSLQGLVKNIDIQKISESGKKAWAEGKFANRKSNNMRDFIWVRRKDDGSRTRIKRDSFDDSLYIIGR